MGNDFDTETEAFGSTDANNAAEVADQSVNLGRLIDDLYALREQRLALNETIEDLKRRESDLRGKIMALLQSTGLTGARGELATSSIKHATVPKVVDWEAFQQYIVTNDAWDLMQRRVSTTACSGRWDRGEIIAGVDKLELTELNLTKATR